MSLYGDRAYDYFIQGYNCSQSVAAAFSDRTAYSPSQLLVLSSGFGGGVGRLREVCGALSGAVLILSLLYGSDSPEGKTAIYTHIQQFAALFQARNGMGTLLCRDLLGLRQAEGSPVAGERTRQYYRERPCPQLVRLSADLLDEYIRTHS